MASSSLSVALAARVVEVIADLGELVTERYRYGSGCIVRGRTVLTAAHVVTGAVAVKVRGPDKRPYSATLDSRFVGNVGGPGPDLALLEIDHPSLDLPSIELARVDRESPLGEPVERCHAVGYPWFAETPLPTTVRDTVDAIGVVPGLSKLAAGMLSVLVSASPRPLPPASVKLAESEWSGMSGAPVLAAGRLLGVVIEHAPRDGQSAITAVPVTAIEFDPAHPAWGTGVSDPAMWWSRLGVSGLDALRRVPPRSERPAPAYRETLGELGRTLNARMPQLLGRERELNEIAAFAVGGPGYRWLVGGAFAGKSALLFESVMVGLPADVDVVSYFLSRRASDADSNRFLAAVVPQLAYLCEVEHSDVDRDQFKALWRRATERAAELGRHLLLVVDGLDEDVRPSGSPSVASLLPVLTEGRAHALVSSRPHPELPADLPDGHPLRLTRPTELEPFKGSTQLVDLAKAEIHDLTHGTDVEFAVNVLGLLTAASGPLSVDDIVTLSSDLTTPTASAKVKVRRVLERAARSLEPVGTAERPRYQFAHLSLLEFAKENEDLRDPEYRDRIHQWAELWKAGGWSLDKASTPGTPRYLLDSYPASLSNDLNRLESLLDDVGWVDSAIRTVGVDSVLANLRSARTGAAAKTPRMMAVVAPQAMFLRPPRPVNQPGYVVRQLCLQAMELGEEGIASALRARLLVLSEEGPVPLSTSRRAGQAIALTLGSHSGDVWSAAELPSGQVATGGGGQVLLWDLALPGAAPTVLSTLTGLGRAMAGLDNGRVVGVGIDGRVRRWDPATPGAAPVELGREEGIVRAVVELDDGRVVTGGADGRVRLWDPAAPGAAPVDLGMHKRAVWAVARLEDGRVVTGGDDGRVRLWDPLAPGAAPVELGTHNAPFRAMAELDDGRVVSVGFDGRVLLWDPATPGAAPVELGRHDGSAWAVAVLNDGRVVTGGFDRRVLRWDPTTPGARPVELGTHDGPVWMVGALHDGRVVTGGEDRAVLLWDPAIAGDGPAVLETYDAVGGATVRLFTGRYRAAKRARRVMLWDPASPDGGPVELGTYADRLAWMVGLGGGRLVTVGDDGRMLLWDQARPGHEPVELGVHGGGVQSVAVLPGGRVITSADVDRDDEQQRNESRLLLWNPDSSSTGPTELSTQSVDDEDMSVSALPDGKIVTWAKFSGQVLLWDPTAPGTYPVQLGTHEGGAGAVAAWPGGEVVTGGSDGRVLVWNPMNRGGPPVELGTHRGAVHTAAMLDDGRLVTVGDEGRVLLWDRASPDHEPIELGVHEGGVRTVAVLPNGLVATGGPDRRVILWDAPAGNRIAEIACSVGALTLSDRSSPKSCLFVTHEGAGLSAWSITETRNDPTASGPGVTPTTS